MSTSMTSVFVTLQSCSLLLAILKMAIVRNPVGGTRLVAIINMGYKIKGITGVVNQLLYAGG